MRRTWAARWWIMLVVLIGLLGLLIDRVARGGPSRRGDPTRLSEPAAPPAPAASAAPVAPALPRADQAAESPAPPRADSPAAELPAAEPATAEVGAESAARGVHPGPYPGSALPLADGSAPTAEYKIKANAATRRSHGPDSPYYARTRAQVWFLGIDDAEAAGFRHWSRKK